VEIQEQAETVPYSESSVLRRYPATRGQEQEEQDSSPGRPPAWDWRPNQKEKKRPPRTNRRKSAQRNDEQPTTSKRGENVEAFLRLNATLFRSAP
jgi:hypothetical protein